MTGLRALLLAGDGLAGDGYADKAGLEALNSDGSDLTVVKADGGGE